jgi:hypothetical protein
MADISTYGDSFRHYVLPVYQRIAEEALHLLQLRMNPNRIAVALKVDRTTVVRALRWMKDKSTNPDQGHIDP